MCVCIATNKFMAAPCNLQPLHHLTIKVWTAPDKIRAMRTKPLQLWGEGKIGQLRWQHQQETAPFETGRGCKECLSKDTARIVTSTKGASVCLGMCSCVCLFVCVCRCVCVRVCVCNRCTILINCEGQNVDVLGSLTYKDFKQCSFKIQNNNIYCTFSNIKNVVYTLM